MMKNALVFLHENVWVALTIIACEGEDVAKFLKKSAVDFQI